MFCMYFWALCSPSSFQYRRFPLDRGTAVLLLLLLWWSGHFILFLFVQRFFYSLACILMLVAVRCKNFYTLTYHKRGIPNPTKLKEFWIFSLYLFSDVYLVFLVGLRAYIYTTCFLWTFFLFPSLSSLQCAYNKTCSLVLNVQKFIATAISDHHGKKLSEKKTTI